MKIANFLKQKKILIANCCSFFTLFLLLFHSITDFILKFPKLWFFSKTVKNFLLDVIFYSPPSPKFCGFEWRQLTNSWTENPILYFNFFGIFSKTKFELLFVCMFSKLLFFHFIFIVNINSLQYICYLFRKQICAFLNIFFLAIGIFGEILWKQHIYKLFLLFRNENARENWKTLTFFPVTNTLTLSNPS